MEWETEVGTLARKRGHLNRGTDMMAQGRVLDLE